MRNAVNDAGNGHIQGFEISVSSISVVLGLTFNNHHLKGQLTSLEDLKASKSTFEKLNMVSHLTVNTLTKELFSRRIRRKCASAHFALFSCSRAIESYSCAL